MSGKRSDFIELTELSMNSELYGELRPQGKVFIRLSAIDVIAPIEWACGTVYFVQSGTFSRYVIENPLIVSGDING